MSQGWQRGISRGGGSGSGRIQITPFKHSINTDPDFANRTWSKLQDALRRIQDRDMADLSYEALYRYAYNMVLHKHGEFLFRGVQDELRRHLEEIQMTLESCVDEEELLESMKIHWGWYCRSLGQIRDVLMYFDRTFVMKKKMTSIYDLGLKMFRKIVLVNSCLGQRATEGAIRRIERARSGDDRVGLSLVRAITEMFTAVEREEGLEGAYLSSFEPLFLTRTAEFYAVESRRMLSESNCSDYLRKAEQCLMFEDELAQRCLDYHRTASKLKSVTEKQLLENHVYSILEMEGSGVVWMIRSHNLEGLNRVYRLLSKIPEARTRMREILKEEASLQGSEIVRDPESKEPCDIISSALELRKKFDEIISKSFSRTRPLSTDRAGIGAKDLAASSHVVDRYFLDAVNEAFKPVANVPTFPEYLVLFIDRMFRSNSRGWDETSIESELDTILTLFRLSDEKDLFEKHYKTHLSKRLLYHKSSSEDAERMFLAKLKNECGQIYTSKLEAMFSDIRNSSDMTQAFHDSMECPLDLSVSVLTTGSWPITYVPSCHLPMEIVGALDMFRQFYFARHEGRRLSWIADVGSSGELRARFGSDESPRTYDLQVNAYQLVLLLLFNDASNYTFQELAERTAIPDEALQRTLLSLSLGKVRLLLKERKTKEIDNDEVFALNEGFTSKLIRIRVQTISSRKVCER